MEGRIEENGLVFNLGYAKRSSFAALAALIAAYLFLVVSAALLLTPSGSVWLMAAAIVTLLALHAILRWARARGDQIIVRLTKPSQRNGPAHFSLDYDHNVLCEGDLTENRLEVRRVVGSTGRYQQLPCISNQICLVVDELPKQLEDRRKEGLVLFEREQVEDAINEVEKIYEFLGTTHRHG